MKRILIFVLVIFSLTSCDKKQTDEESEVVGERIRIKKISYGAGHYGEFIYDSKGLFIILKSENSMAEIKYNSSNLPISVSLTGHLNDNYTIDWSDNNSKYTILVNGVKDKYPWTRILNSKNQISKYEEFDQYYKIPKYYNFKWYTDSLNIFLSSDKFDYCLRKIKFSNKKNPLQNINIALLEIFDLGIGGLGFDYQNSFLPIKNGEYDPIDKPWIITFSYTFNENNYPIMSSHQINEDKQTYIEYYEYEKY